MLETRWQAQRLTEAQAAVRATSRYRVKTPEEIFWDDIMPVTESGCWLWLGSLAWFGHGTLKTGGRSNPKGLLAHRLSWEIHHGPIPDGLNVCHKCDIPSCVNPAHLYLGTIQDNMRDKRIRKRSAGAKQKSCVNGHPFDAENTYFHKRKDGYTIRRCRTCNREYMRQRYFSNPDAALEKRREQRRRKAWP